MVAQPPRPTLVSDDLPFLDIAGKYPLLTRREEILLGRRIQAWLTHPEPVPPAIVRSGRRARDRFVLCNLRLVASIARYYTRRLDGTSLTYADLLQEGVIGLQRSAELYIRSFCNNKCTHRMCFILESITRVIYLIHGSIGMTLTAQNNLTDYTEADGEGGTRSRSWSAPAWAPGPRARRGGQALLGGVVDRRHAEQAGGW